MPASARAPLCHFLIPTLAESVRAPAWALVHTPHLPVKEVHHVLVRRCSTASVRRNTGLQVAVRHGNDFAPGAGEALEEGRLVLSESLHSDPRAVFLQQGPVGRQADHALVQAMLLLHEPVADSRPSLGGFHVGPTLAVGAAPRHVADVQFLRLCGKARLWITLNDAHWASFSSVAFPVLELAAAGVLLREILRLEELEIIVVKDLWRLVEHSAVPELNVLLAAPQGTVVLDGHVVVAHVVRAEITLLDAI